ncbi:MAG: hypothetical protein L0Y72_03300 [Gemmataceae bacterium]|nr:hypothetical protein [Gemmataceae bacterium]MCI0738044.1 hypothetical protein [Gemmataceae bacterium]
MIICNGVVGLCLLLGGLAHRPSASRGPARADRLQTSMNLAVGSALACIGLTVPVVVLASILFDLPLASRDQK